MFLACGTVDLNGGEQNPYLAEDSQSVTIGLLAKPGIPLTCFGIKTLHLAPFPSLGLQTSAQIRGWPSVGLLAPVIDGSSVFLAKPGD